VNRLKGTPYSSVLAPLPPPYAARRLELAFRERLANAHFLLMNQAREYDLISLYYMRQIAWDLKSVLKSKALRKEEEPMEYLTMHAEELVGRRDLIVRVLASRDLAEAVSLLSGTEFSEDLQKGVAMFSAKGEVRFFDLYLDHAVVSRIAEAYFTKAKKYATSRAVDIAGVGEMVALDVNAYNILSVLRSKLWKLPEEEVRSLVVPPHHNHALVDVQKLIATESLGEATRMLEGDLPRPLPVRGSDEEVIDSVEDIFTAESARVASKAFVWQGLGLASVLALTKLLEFEVKNLSAIAIGIEAHMDTKAVLSKLVF
jgi:V/A-type H+-transporting ATPase subunit C